MTSKEIYDLADRIEASKGDLGADCAAFVGVFGIHQELRRSGWKRWYPDARRWGAALWPLRSLDDLRQALGWRCPAMLASDPRVACAQALRHYADGRVS